MSRFCPDEYAEYHRRLHTTLLAELQFIVASVGFMPNVADLLADIERFAEMYRKHVDTADVEMKKYFPTQ